MMDFQVPPRFRPTLIQIANLTDHAVNELCALLESNPQILTSRDTVYEYATKLPNIDDAGAILEAIIPLLFYKASSAKPTKEVVKEVVGALRSTSAWLLTEIAPGYTLPPVTPEHGQPLASVK